LDPVTGLTDREMFSSRLALPLTCERLDRPPSRELREAVDQSNTAILGFLLHGVDLEAMPRPADERLAEALAPLRTKLDIIIEMLGRLSYRDIELPPTCDVELGPGRVAWLAPSPHQPGEWLRINFYFDAIFREPVVVFGRVTCCTAGSEPIGCRIQAELCEVPESIGESIARLALLRQRRQRAPRPIETALRGER
jgi:hypothetical protein